MSRKPWSAPPLVQPWEGGVAGWLAVFGAVIIELVVATATNHSPSSVAVPVMAAPAAVGIALAAVQWVQARSFGAEPASWWHLLAVLAAAFVWLFFPTSPGLLGAGVTSARQACSLLPTTNDAQCLPLAAQAIDAHNLAWWLTALAIVLVALGGRRSRIAAWVTIPIALAGCEIATHYLEVLLMAYNSG
jgi:hypothetical protein